MKVFLLESQFTSSTFELTAIEMTDTPHLEKKFYSICFTLSEDDILKLDKFDDGTLNNVISNIHKECFGVGLYEENGSLSVDFFYVTKPYKLQGDIICLKLNDPDYFPLLFKFCHLLAVSYKELDIIDSLNTFQTKLRSYLEKIGYFTVTTLELKRFAGQEITMMSPFTKGIKIVDLIDKIDFYRDFFKGNYKISEASKKEYVYLMVNTDTSLIKIGFSINPKYRERTLHSQEPTVHLVACWESNKKREKELHEKYKHKRVRGEWFRLNMTDLHGLEKFMNGI